MLIRFDKILLFTVSSPVVVADAKQQRFNSRRQRVLAATKEGAYGAQPLQLLLFQRSMEKNLAHGGLFSSSFEKTSKYMPVTWSKFQKLLRYSIRPGRLNMSIGLVEDNAHHS